MPDYLSCGACHAEFEVVDFYRFVDHKVSNCNVRYNNGDQLAGAESVLECSKCLKKCRTPWALLQHLQSEHYMSLARTLLLPSDSAPGPYLAGGRQRSVDQTDMSEACTQTARSCLKRQVCPYEEGLPDECCLKASKEQLASDSGCCCMDSYGTRQSGEGGCRGDAACATPVGGGSGGGGNGAVNGGCGDRQTDCCLAVPKKRRLLTAAATAAAAASADVGNADVVATSAPSSSTVAMASDTSAVACCRLTPDCALQRQTKARQVRSAECQTDFVDSLMDLDVNMLLEDTGVDVPTSLVTQIASTGSPPSLSTSPSGMRRPQPPAPSKAIQTIYRLAAEPTMVTAAQVEQPQPQPPPAIFFSAPIAPQYQQQQPLYHQAEAEPSQHYQQQEQLQHTPPPLQQQPDLIKFQQPPLNSDFVSDDDGGVEGLAIGQEATRPPPRPKELLKYRCVQCPRTFRQNIHLRKHVMSQHSHSKPHKCPSCEYTTVEKSHLTVHIRKHTGERPFSCRNCAYSTAQNCTLKAHYLRKHPGSTVTCARCSLEFVTEHERDKHERSCSTGAEFLGPTG